ncbi:MAG: tyrosine-type recombinase/integrase [Actinomycetota bacterium]|nr:tyrosine-type recombinase/integrase [Actinomycetota bacterium]
MSGQPAPERVRVSGPLVGFVDGFRGDLLERGYSLWGAQEHLYLLAHVSRWMESEGLEVAALTPGTLERYFLWRRWQGYLSSLSPLSLRTLLGYLDGLGVLPVEDVVLSPVDRLLGEFRDYLLRERGMKAGSAAQYEPTARLFLSERSEPLEVDLACVSAAEVSTFVVRESRRRSRRSTETVVYALRALLRFLHVHGLIAEPLAEAVPSVARRREDLPRALPPGQVTLLLGSCDRATPTGRRDYAIVLLLARLGLRRCEVAALSLDDVDWRAGEIVVHGKGSRIDRLPLPCDIGEAIAEYLRDGRPRVAVDRSLFINACAPLVGISRRCVTGVVRCACMRAGIGPVGPHRLRHTAATELLRHGAGLAEIGQVLRHQDQTTTSVYAKVDRAALSPLALPWPGSER